MDDLKTILEWVRPSGSVSEQVFADWLEARIVQLGYNPERDGYGNLFVKTAGCTTLFTSHTDTVHAHGLEGRQEVSFENGFAFLTNPQNGNVLGADCGTGIYIMLKLLEHGVRANYAFYRDEEVGGLGSEYSVKTNPDFYKPIRHAVAFDRKDVCSVITHQWCGRCCSDEFAKALGGKLGLKPDNTGSFTDTANMAHIVPECTNLSVGYYDQHTASEMQDLGYLSEFVEKLKTVDWQSLPVERNPAQVCDDDYGNSSDYGWQSDKDDMEAEIDMILSYGRGYISEVVLGKPDLAEDLIAYLLGI